METLLLTLYRNLRSSSRSLTPPLLNSSAPHPLLLLLPLLVFLILLRPLRLLLSFHSTPTIAAGYTDTCAPEPHDPAQDRLDAAVHPNHRQPQTRHAHEPQNTQGA